MLNGRNTFGSLDDLQGQDFLDTLNEMAELCQMLRGLHVTGMPFSMGSGGIAIAAPPPEPPPPRIWVKVTDSDGADHAWTQQRRTASDTWEDMPDGLSGTTSERPLRDVNELVIPVDTIVEAWPEIGKEGGVYWLCDVSAQNSDALFPVIVTPDGGSAGTVVTSTTCSFTYTVKDLDGATLGVNMTPETARIPSTKYQTPSNDSPGIAYYDSQNPPVIHLYHVAEEVPFGSVVTVVTGIEIDYTDPDLRYKEYTTKMSVLDAGSESEGDWQPILETSPCEE